MQVTRIKKLIYAIVICAVIIVLTVTVFAKESDHSVAEGPAVVLLEDDTLWAETPMVTDKPGETFQTIVNPPEVIISAPTDIPEQGNMLYPNQPDDELSRSTENQILTGQSYTTQEVWDEESSSMRRATENDLDLDNDSMSCLPQFPNGIVAKGSDEDIVLDSGEVNDLLSLLDVELETERKAVILKAYSLVGKVKYFWGGKSSVIGWDQRWGNEALVTSSGTSTSGQYRSYGLDCSGFITWSFNNAAGEDMSALIKNGSSNQWQNSVAVEWENARPGDLAFFAVPGEREINHVGIVVGRSEGGKLMAVHCSSNKNGVVITEAQAAGFRQIRKPNIYDNAEFKTKAQEVFVKDFMPAKALWEQSTNVEFGEARFGDVVFLYSPQQSEFANNKPGIVIGLSELGGIVVAYTSNKGNYIKTVELGDHVHIRRMAVFTKIYGSASSTEK